MEQQGLLLPDVGALVVAGAPFVVFELSGKPRGKGSVRHRVITPRPGTKSWARGMRKPFTVEYIDEETQSYLNDFEAAAKAAMQGRAPSENPVAVLIHAFMPIPQSWPMRKRQNALIGALRPTGKPDWDNIGKMLDAMTGVVWIDDAPVVDGRVIKMYSDVPGLRVEVREFIPPG